MVRASDILTAVNQRAGEAGVTLYRQLGKRGGRPRLWAAAAASFAVDSFDRETIGRPSLRCEILPDSVISAEPGDTIQSVYKIHIYFFPADEVHPLDEMLEMQHQLAAAFLREPLAIGEDVTSIPSIEFDIGQTVRDYNVTLVAEMELTIGEDWCDWFGEEDSELMETLHINNEEE